MKILIAEDDLDTAKYLVSILDERNFITEIAQTGYDALDAIKSTEFDLFCLDLDMPYINGKDVLKKIRKLNIHMPIMIISALSNIKDKINLFALGADDYITKPFDSRELLARVEALMRRSFGAASSTIKFGSLTVDLSNQIAYMDNASIPLTKKEYVILELLVRRKNSLISKEVFLDHLYNNVCDEPNSKIIDVFICKLRKKILALAGPNTMIPNIKTIWGRGYLLCLEEINGNIVLTEEMLNPEGSKSYQNFDSEDLESPKVEDSLSFNQN